jgi:hypothetical protein
MEYHEAERVVHYIATDPWTIDEMNDILDRARAIYDNAPQRIYTIVDVSQAKHMPQGVMRGRANPEFTHPNVAGLLIVGASVLVRTITGVVAKLANSDRIHFFEKLDDAWAFVRSETSAEAGK